MLRFTLTADSLPPTPPCVEITRDGAYRPDLAMPAIVAALMEHGSVTLAVDGVPKTAVVMVDGEPVNLNLDDFKLCEWSVGDMNDLR